MRGGVLGVIGAGPAVDLVVGDPGGIGREADEEGERADVEGVADEDLDGVATEWQAVEAGAIGRSRHPRPGRDRRAARGDSSGGKEDAGADLVWASPRGNGSVTTEFTSSK